MKAGAAYFGLVFSAGFVLGAIRTLWIVPLVGVRSAELIESPIMLLVTLLAARRINRKGLAHPLGVGLIALGFLLAAEIAVALGIRHERLRDYIANRDPVSGTAYLVLLVAFATMPFFMSRRCGERSAAGDSVFLDPFIPRPDVRERHHITINAPASLVVEVARNFDIQSIAAVRVMFRLRSMALGAKGITRRPQGLIADMSSLGWTVLAESENYVVMGAACQPWKADVSFSPIPAGEFASFNEPDCLKIAWTIEAESLDATVTHLATETRVLATDDVARAKFRSYWRKFGLGIVMIRRSLLSAVRREAESRQIRK